MRETLRHFCNALTDLIFPPICLHCEQLITTQTIIPHICLSCLATLPPLPSGYTRNVLLADLTECYLDDLFIPFDFNDVIQSISHGFKYQKMPKLAESTGRLLATEIRSELSLPEKALLIPVPIHPQRQLEREYNQSLHIARGFRQVLAISLTADILQRNKYTATQTRLNRAQRQFNVKDAFQVDKSSQLSEKTVLLLDDVYTTGATMNECAWLLKENGASAVIGIAFATPLQKSDAPVSDVE